MNAEWVGAVAGACTTVAFVPQVWRVWKTRSARDLSLPTYAVFTFGVVLWFVYGILIGSLPILLSNGLTLVFAGSVLAMKLRFG